MTFRGAVIATSFTNVTKLAEVEARDKAILALSRSNNLAVHFPNDLEFADRNPAAEPRRLCYCGVLHIITVPPSKEVGPNVFTFVLVCLSVCLPVRLFADLSQNIIDWSLSKSYTSKTFHEHSSKAF